MTRIVRDTGSTVLIESRPWGLGLFLTAMILVGAHMAFQG